MLRGGTVGNHWKSLFSITKLLRSKEHLFVCVGGGCPTSEGQGHALECPLHSMGSGTQTGHQAWQWHRYPLSLLVVPRRCSSVIVANLVSIAKTKNPWQSTAYDSVRSELKCGPQCHCVAGGAGQSCGVFQSDMDEPARNTLDSHYAFDFELMFGYDLS